jgi:hypothetical protein
MSLWTLDTSALKGVVLVAISYTGWSDRLGGGWPQGAWGTAVVAISYVEGGNGGEGVSQTGLTLLGVGPVILQIFEGCG